MLTLFHSPRSRSTRAIWLLEELGADYRIQYVDIRRMDGSGRLDPKNPHPLKQVPALVHGEAVIVESGFIFQYLTDLHPQAGLAPMPGDPKRAEYLSWLGLYTGVLEPVITAKFQDTQKLSGQFERAYSTLDEHWRATLAEKPYLLGDSFSAADILLGSVLMFFRTVMPAHAEYDAWLDRLKERPALARAGAKDSPPSNGG